MKKLEDILNLPDNLELKHHEQQKIKNTLRRTRESDKRKKPKAENLFRDISEFDKIAQALPEVQGLGKKSDEELDILAEKATKSYDDLMDLGMNVELRYASKIFDVAANMLKNAIEAKATKLDGKLRMIELQLKKQKLDSESGSKEQSIPGEGYLVTDRNSLLERLKKNQ